MHTINVCGWTTNGTSLARFPSWYGELCSLQIILVSKQGIFVNFPWNVYSTNNPLKSKQKGLHSGTSHVTSRVSKFLIMYLWYFCTFVWISVSFIRHLAVLCHGFSVHVPSPWFGTSINFMFDFFFSFLCNNWKCKSVHIFLLFIFIFLQIKGSIFIENHPSTNSMVNFILSVFKMG